MRRSIAVAFAAAVVASLLVVALASAGPAAAAQPTSQWATWFATDTLPAGTWPVGTYEPEHPFWVLHATWKLPAPGGDVVAALPVGGPYTVSASAPLYQGTVLIAAGRLVAMTSGTLDQPVCSEVMELNPYQPTRLFAAATEPTQMTLAEWQKAVATYTVTATLGDGPGWVLPMSPVATAPYASPYLSIQCPFTTSRAVSRSLFEGDWTATDHFDGSTELLNVTSGSTPAVTYTDLFASVCANAGARSTVFDASGNGTISRTEAGMVLDVTYSRAGCGSYRFPLTSMTFTYDPATDTMLDNNGDTWHRQVAGPIAPCPPGTNCTQVTSGSGTQATLIADPGSTWTPLFDLGTSYFGPAIPGGNCVSGDPLDANGVLGFQLNGPTTTKVIVLALDPALVTHGIGLLRVCWSQETPFTPLGGGAKVNTGDLPSCQGGNQVAPCVLSKTSGQHNAAFLSILAPANDPNDPYAYGHW